MNTMMELETVNSDKYKSVVERYYTQKYFINDKSPGEDVCVLTHSNKICIITLAEHHPILVNKKSIVSVDYQFDKVNRLCNRVSGKGKKGAQNLRSDSALCRISCEDKTQYIVPCGIKCQLLETNDNLKNDPTVLTEKPLSDGFIAIVLPKLKDFKDEIDKLCSKDEYLATVNSKDEPT